MGRYGPRLELSKRRGEKVYKGGLEVGPTLKGGEQVARFGVPPLGCDGNSHSNRTGHQIRSLQRLARLCFSLVQKLRCQDAPKAGEGQLAGAPGSHDALPDFVSIVLFANGGHSIS